MQVLSLQSGNAVISTNVTRHDLAPDATQQPEHELNRDVRSIFAQKRIQHFLEKVKTPRDETIVTLPVQGAGFHQSTLPRSGYATTWQDEIDAVLHGECQVPGERTSISIIVDIESASLLRQLLLVSLAGIVSHPRLRLIEHATRMKACICVDNSHADLVRHTILKALPSAEIQDATATPINPGK